MWVVLQERESDSRPGLGLKLGSLIPRYPRTFPSVMKGAGPSKVGKRKVLRAGTVHDNDQQSQACRLWGRRVLDYVIKCHLLLFGPCPDRERYERCPRQGRDQLCVAVHDDHLQRQLGYLCCSFWGFRVLFLLLLNTKRVLGRCLSPRSYTGSFADWRDGRWLRFSRRFVSLERRMCRSMVLS